MSSRMLSKTRMKKFLDFHTFSFQRGSHAETDEMIEDNEEDRGEGEINLKKLIETEVQCISQKWSVENIEQIVTAKNLCSCKNPIDVAFKVNCKLRELANFRTENTGFLSKLADQTEDFAVQLIDQVNTSEELILHDGSENVDRYASMLSGLTDDAIVHSQKKFVSHPLLYKRLKLRWRLGLPAFLKRHAILLYLFILIDSLLTPLLLPVAGIAFYKDQKRRRMRSMLQSKPKEQTELTPSKPEKPPENALDMYFAYLTTPFVIFIKDKLSHFAFILLHCRICTVQSSVSPLTEEYLVFVFFCAIVLSEYQQYKTSPLKYFKDMWNYVDVLILLVYILIIVLRIVTVARGGNIYHNRLLEIVHYFYGINTLFLIVRFSSILELNAVVGPLQLALFRMCVDLFIIIVQFSFIIFAFSMAITKCYRAGISFDTPQSDDQYQQTNVTNHEPPGLVEILGPLMWSVFDQAAKETLKNYTYTSLSTFVVLMLYYLFLILSVIMLVNMLVALLTKTYDNATTNAEIEWKFSRAVVENQYRNLHPIVVPFNLLSVPITYCLLGGKKDARKAEADDCRKSYRIYYQVCLFPVIKERYKKKFGGSFPLSVEEKMDLVMEKLQVLPTGEDSSEQQLHEPPKNLEAEEHPPVMECESIVLSVMESERHITNSSKTTDVAMMSSV